MRALACCSFTALKPTTSAAGPFANMRLASLFPLLGFAATPAYSRPSPSFQDNCVALASKIHLNYDFTVNIVQYLPPNGTIDYKAEGMNETCLTASVAYPIPMGVCRLNLRVQTTAHSEIYMEVWLPEKWTGRVMTTGNGGLAGCTYSAPPLLGISNIGRIR